MNKSKIKQSEWKMFPGKADCWGNVSHYIIHHKDNYWLRKVVRGDYEDAAIEIELLNAGSGIEPLPKF